MPRAGPHKPVPLEQDTIYGCPLANGDDDDKKMFFIALKVNQLFTTLKMQTVVLLRVTNPFPMVYELTHILLSEPNLNSPFCWTARKAFNTLV